MPTDKDEPDEIDFTFWHDDEASAWKGELYLDSEQDEPVELEGHSLRDLFKAVQEIVLKEHYGDRFRNFRPSPSQRHLKVVK